MKKPVLAYLVFGAVAFGIIVLAQQTGKNKSADMQRLWSMMYPTNPVILLAYEEKQRPLNDLEKKAGLLLEQGNPDAAEQAMRERRRLGGHDQFNKQLRCEINLAQGQYQKALNVYQINENNIHGNTINLNIALAFARLKKYDAARHFCQGDSIPRPPSQSAKKQLPGTQTPKDIVASILLLRGESNVSTGNYQDALKAFQQAEHLAPGNGYLSYLTALSLMRLECYREAIPYFKKAIQNWPLGPVENMKDNLRNCDYLQNQDMPRQFTG